MVKTVVYSKTKATELLENDEVEIHEVFDENFLEILSEIRSLPDFKVAQFKRRFKRGDKCYVAYKKNKPCHFAWVMQDGYMGISSAKKNFKLTEDLVWIYDCRTKDAYKGQGIYPQVIGKISNDILNNNDSVLKVRIDTTSDNYASQKGILKAGFSPEMTIYRFWKFKWVTHAG